MTRTCKSCYRDHHGTGPVCDECAEKRDAAFAQQVRGTMGEQVRLTDLPISDELREARIELIE